ncbi:uncharacterized mitochondrial protein AtMg00860-like [Lycium ferocissimum]|uniref:uncharacterized mitochondrial protein AtMg00860-like n=1 Tax=Lycium ferocissimum TaxID=112874 RepID=UPI0028152E96|nr:uncharacterized mitochondrial protein AtMg00860-like [Lycium ferocissimum]
MAKARKCVFAARRVEYLGHYFSPEEVATYHKKIEVVQGSTGYYRRSMQGCGVISKPLTELLKKENFNSNQQSTEAFNRLKKPSQQLQYSSFQIFLDICGGDRCIQFLALEQC